MRMCDVERILSKRSYRLKKRGTVDIRGEGRLTTYLLLANENLTDEELLGRDKDAKLQARQPDHIIVRYA